MDIHFIHVRSAHENALPLIMTHGWPGSVVELIDTVGPLTDPTAHGGSAEDAFHLVLPSLPGYGLSGEPVEVGWDLGRTARAWAELMRRLGYTRYVAQGGDVGAGVTDAMGRQAPEGLVGIHTNLLVPALGGPMPTDTDEERAAAAQIATFGQSGNGYFVEMATRPQTIGYALLDSPVALAAWMLDHDTDAYYKIARAFVDGQPSGNLSRDHVLDNITLYWLTGTGASAARSYWEAYGPDAPAAARASAGADDPVRLHDLPGEIWRTPRSWVEASYPNVTYFNRSTRAATSPPGKSRSSSRPRSGRVQVTARMEQACRDEQHSDRRPRARRLRRRLELERRDQRLQAKGVKVTAPANPLRGIAADSAYIAGVFEQIDGPVLAVGHSYGGAVITNAATEAKNVVGLVYVAAFAPDEGETLGAVEAGSKDSVLNSALVPLHVPDGGRRTATEFAIDPAKVRDAFAGDLPVEQTAVMAATQRPVAEWRSPRRRAAGVEEPAVLGGRRHRRQGGRRRRRPLDGRAGRREDHRGRGLARDHDLPAPGRDRRDPGGGGRRRRRVRAARRLGVRALARSVAATTLTLQSSFRRRQTDRGRPPRRNPRRGGRPRSA